MLMSESLQVQELFRQAMLDRYGEAGMPPRFRAFDTICSATQDRQDAVVALLKEQPLDLMIVIGGYNSSNTCNLARICAQQVPTFHIADPDCLESADVIRHRPAGGKARDPDGRVAARRRKPGDWADVGGLNSRQSGRDDRSGGSSSLCRRPARG